MKHQARSFLMLLIASAFATSAGQPARPAAMPGSEAPLPTTDDSSQAVVYRDVLSLGWEDWSWDSKIQLASTEHAHASDGTVSIRAELEPWGAFSLQYPSGFSTSPYQWIEFYIYVGENTLRRLSFVFNGNSDNDLLPRVSIDDPRYIAGETYIANRWQRVRIPLADTGGAETVIWGININDASGDGQEPFWVDGIRFIASAPPAVPGPGTASPTIDASDQLVVYRDVLSLGWEDWSWDSDIQLASTQHAHASDGTVSIRAELEPWGALSLRYPSGLRTSAYQSIEFYIYVGENTLRRLSFSFGGPADDDLLPRVFIDNPRFIASETYIPNRWQRVSIPLVETGGSDTVIWGITIKNESGDGQEPFWVDGIRFLASTPPAIPLPTVDAVKPAIVYRDSLALGWEDWSWISTIQLASTQHAHASDGTVSIQAEMRPWGALSLGYPSGLSTSPYEWIEFYIYVGENTLRRLSFVFTGSSDKDLLPLVPIDDPRYIAGETYLANRWQRVRIPLAETGGADTVIRSINIRDASGHGQEPFWVDGIRFLTSTPLATPAPTLPPKEASAAVVYQNKLALAWEEWSWYSTVDLASREHAHSRPVSIKASLGATGALSLHVPGFNTAAYEWLEFYIYVGDNTLRQLSVYFNDAADKQLVPIVSVNDPAFIALGAFVPNRWQRVRIPLSRTGGADMDILRINIQDASGDWQGPFWIDDIRFLPADPESR